MKDTLKRDLTVTDFEEEYHVEYMVTDHPPMNGMWFLIVGSAFYTFKEALTFAEHSGEGPRRIVVKSIFTIED